MVLLSGKRIASISPLSTSHYAPPGPGVSHEQALSNVFAWERERGDVWAEDIHFVLDRLTDLNRERGGFYSTRFDWSGSERSAIRLAVDSRCGPANWTSESAHVQVLTDRR